MLDANRPIQISLSQTQIEFLIYVESLDDWHRDWFVNEVRKQHEETRLLKDEEFKEMLSILEGFSSDQIFELQLALNLFGQLLLTKFEDVISVEAS